jgi:(p)ppGpp synthase/HD superfamily hydrolase
VSSLKELGRFTSLDALDPYIEHPIAVGLILAENGANPETVAVALLHDVPSALAIRPVAEIRSRFGDIVAGILEDFLRCQGHAGIDD